MSCFQFIYLGNAVVLELSGLKNSVTGDADTSATVTATLLDASGIAVAGVSWPVSMPHAGAGTYRVTIADELSLIDGAEYTARIVAEGSGGEPGRWDIPCQADLRTR